MSRTTWTALPQRKKFVTTSEPLPKKPRVREPPTDSATTEERLLAQDGVAGEFFEYLDHTADVQCHAWGKNLPEAFQNIALCTFVNVIIIVMLHHFDLRHVQLHDGSEQDLHRS